jgi:ribosomal protein S12 methylthiotransferase accessory factor
MESLEFFHAEEVREQRMHVRLGEMRPELRYNPRALLRPAWGALEDTRLVEWVRATDLCSGDPTWVPVQLCELNAVVTDRLAAIHFLPASNGLASGNTFCEALVHGLCELIERDAVAREATLRFTRARTVPLATIPSGTARELMDLLQATGGRLHVHAPRSDTGLPCFEVFFKAEDVPTVTFFGAGCATRRELALVRALTEVAQSRVTHIAGSRDDLDYRNYPAVVTAPAVGGPTWPDGGDVRFDAVPELEELTLTEELTILVARIRNQTGIAPMAVDLSRPELGLPVVYVVAPGLRVNHYEGVT